MMGSTWMISCWVKRQSVLSNGMPSKLFRVSSNKPRALRKHHGDSGRVEEGGGTVARRSKDETTHPDKENTETEKPEAKKAKSDRPVEPVVFFHTWYTDKKGVFRKRRKPNWKVAARKQFGGYFHSRGSKVRSTMTNPAPSSEPEGL